MATQTGEIWDDDLRWIAPDPAPVSRKRRLPWIRIAIGSAIMVAILVRYAPDPRLGPLRPSELALRPPPTLVAPPPRWEILPDAEGAFGLDAVDLPALPSRHELRLHGDGTREHLLFFGDFERSAAHLQVSLRRDGTATEEPGSLFVHLVRRSAEVGLAVKRVAQARPLATRFGSLEAAEAVLEDGRERACLVFRLPDGPGGVRLFGWLCDPAANPERLACTLDGLTVLDDGGDAALADFFATSRPGSACAAGRVAAVATSPETALSPHADAVPSRLSAPMPPPRPNGLGHP